jgi:hypothetical protein
LNLLIPDSIYYVYMDTFGKITVVSIGLVTAIFSLLAGGFLGGINYLSIIIASIPVILGRVVFGKDVLNHIRPIYISTIVFLSVIQAPIRLFPEFYLEFYLEVYALVFGAPESAIIGNLDSALAYEPIIACLAMFSILYIYREGYPNLIRQKLLTLSRN